MGDVPRLAWRYDAAHHAPPVADSLGRQDSRAPPRRAGGSGLARRTDGALRDVSPHLRALRPRAAGGRGRGGPEWAMRNLTPAPSPARRGGQTRARVSD